RAESVAEGVRQADAHAVRGVPPVSGDRARTPCVPDRTESPADLTDSRLPWQPLPTGPASSEGMKQAVRLGLVIRDVHALDTHVPCGDGVLGIGANSDHAAVLNVDLEAAERLAGADFARRSKGRHEDLLGRYPTHGGVLSLERKGCRVDCRAASHR